MPTSDLKPSGLFDFVAAVARQEGAKHIAAVEHGRHLDQIHDRVALLLREIGARREELMSDYDALEWTVRELQRLERDLDFKPKGVADADKR